MKPLKKRVYFLMEKKPKLVKIQVIYARSLPKYYMKLM